VNIVILYGTESGNAEMIAEELAAALSDHEVSIADMARYDVKALERSYLYLVICSTYGEGELPAGAKPFYATLETIKPDLTDLRYAMFGLGDRSYEATYSRGSEIIDGKFRELGAVRIGDYGRHDASSLDVAIDLATAWAERVLHAYETSE